MDMLSWAIESPSRSINITKLQYGHPFSCAKTKLAVGNAILFDQESLLSIETLHKLKTFGFRLGFSVSLELMPASLIDLNLP